MATKIWTRCLHSSGRVAVSRAFSAASPPEDKPKVYVAKFGGSSCGSAKAYKHLGDFFAKHLKDGNHVVGVFSAMFGVTDRLIAALQAAKTGDMETVKASRAKILGLHQRALRDMDLGDTTTAECEEWIEERLRIYFDAVTAAVAKKGEFDAHDQDMISHIGERLSIKMMEAHCKSRGLPAQLVESDQLLVTNDVSGNATPQLDPTQAKCSQILSPLLDKGMVPLVSGFFGTSEDSNKLTTLGRGGTDLTAAVLGHALDADEIMLYKVEYTKDADGWLDEWEPGWIGVVHDNEPDVTIPHMSYRDAAQLAHFGKKVLHPATVHPAVEKGIPISVRNNYDPSHPGTLIGHARASDAPVTSVTSLSVAEYDARHSVGGASLATPQVNVICPMDNDASRAACQVVVSSHILDGVIDDMAHLKDGGIRKLGLGFAEAAVERLASLQQKLQQQIDSLQDESVGADRSELALVAVVGSSLEKIPELGGHVQRLLSANGINNTLPDQVNGSNDHITVVVSMDERKKAVALLHDDLVGKRFRRMDVMGSFDFWEQQRSRRTALGRLGRSASGYMDTPKGGFKPVYGNRKYNSSDFAAY